MTSKRILIDARYLSGTPNGIGRYATVLLEGIAGLDSNNEYIIFHHSSLIETPVKSPNFHYVSVTHRPLSIFTLFGMRRMVKSYNPDLLHVLCPVVPFNYQEPMIITLHDMQPLTQKGFSGQRQLPIKIGYDLFYRYYYPAAIRKAMRVIAISHFTKREALIYAPESAKKIVVIHHGIDEIFLNGGGESKTRIAAYDDLPKKFVLFVGTTRPNKNLVNLIRSYNIFRDEYPQFSQVKFLLVLNKDRFTRQFEKTLDCSPYENDIIVLKAIPDEQLLVLYDKALALVAVTKKEGFCFPFVEALLQGTPCLISNDGALPEVSQGNVPAIDPDDPPAIAAALARLLADKRIRKRLQALVPQLKERFHHRYHAQAVLRSYDFCLNETG